MKVLRAEFVTSAAADATGIPRDGLAQFAFAGRSNVGKSSLLNALMRQKLARTSAAPGKTRLANVFRVTVDGGPGGPGQWACYFVDLPGYGYARGGDAAADELAGVAQAYFSSRVRGTSGEGGSRTAPTLLLVDARHPGLKADVQAHRWISDIAGPPVIVATKVDKLSRAERARNLRELETVFGTAALPVSAPSGEGLDELWRTIANRARGNSRTGDATADADATRDR